MDFGVFDFVLFDFSELAEVLGVGGDFFSDIEEAFEACDMLHEAFDAVVDGLTAGDDEGPVAGLKEEEFASGHLE